MRKVYIGAKPFSRVYLGGKPRQVIVGFPKSLLPDEYAQLEYIESTGTQYIDTGISGGVNAAYEIKFDSLGPTHMQWEQYFCGAKTSIIPKLFAITGGDTPSVGTSFITTRSYFLKSQVSGASVYNYKSDGTMYVDGVINENVTGTTGNGWGVETWYVFNSHGEPTLKSTMRLYALKMWTDSVLMRDFIPAKRKSDGMIGLYDLVSGTFFTDANGGNFTGGDEV